MSVGSSRINVIAGTVAVLLWGAAFGVYFYGRNRLTRQLYALWTRVRGGGSESSRN